MTKTVGVWIDHRRALIVFVDGPRTDTQAISSLAENHPRQSPGSLPSDDIRQRQATANLNQYYDEVVSCIGNAESVLILGPGEAKGELRKRLEKDNLGRRTVDLETSDKITDPQIVAVIRGHFLTRKIRTTSRSSGSLQPQNT